MITDWGKVRHFNVGEFGPRAELVHPTLVHIMDELRERSGWAIRINVAWAEKGHSEKSYHYAGQAIDFAFLRGSSLEQYCFLREFREIGGIGFYPEWNTPGWHIDLRSGFLQWVRHYGIYTYGPQLMSKFLNMRRVK